MGCEKPAVLVVDDELFNLEIIKEYLDEIDVETVCVESGEEALSILQESPQRFSAVLLDRMMPGIDGIEVLRKIKEDESINRLPIIMQTAKAGKDNMIEGLSAGAHYYLSKPYDQQTLVAITLTAIRDYQHYVRVQESLRESAQTLKMMGKGMFIYKSLNDGRNLAALLAKACPKSDSVVLGLTELMINAVEHGNLGIGYNEKTKLNTDGEWEDEISRRLALPLNRDKHVTIDFNRNETQITILITDQGSGFDWQQYMEISPGRAFDSHGRGIAMANLISFNKIEYLETGNKVRITVPIGG
jgi:CheY-like chemotaxis protein